MGRLIAVLLGSLVLATLGRLAEVEPNDSPATATELSLGDTIVGEVASLEDVDYFVVRPETGAFARFEISSERPVFRFYEAHDGSDLVGTQPMGSGHVWLEAGSEPYVAALARYDRQVGSYTLSLLPPVTDRWEAEPNDRPADATPLPDGDRILAASPPGDTVDYFDLDVPADRVMVLVRDGPGPVGVTVNLKLPTDSVEFGWRYDRVSYYFEEHGTALVRASATYCAYPCAASERSALAAYFLTATLHPPGAGDPAEELRGPGPGAPRSLVSGRAGELYVAEGSRVIRIDGDGETVVYESATSPPVDLILDPTGSLLVSTGEALYRIRPDGSREEVPLQYGDGLGGALAIDPDGTFWLGHWNYEPDGTVLGDNWPALGGPRQLLDYALSPDGVLYALVEWAPSDSYPGEFGVIAFDKATGSGRAVVRWRGDARSIALDADGNLYVATRHNGVLQVTEDGTPGDAPFALKGLDGVSVLAFGRSGTGEMTRDLLAIDDRGALYRLDPEGVPAPGAPPWAPPGAPPGITPAAVAAVILGDSAALGREALVWADLAGNWDGRLDLGDFVALADGGGSGSSQADPASGTGAW